VTNRLFAQTTHVELPPPNCHVGWGHGRSHIFQVSFKSVQGFRLNKELSIIRRFPKFGITAQPVINDITVYCTTEAFNKVIVFV